MIEEEDLEEESDSYDDYDYYDYDDEERDPALDDIDWGKVVEMDAKFREKEVYITNLDFPFHTHHMIDGTDYSGWHLIQCTGHKFFDAQAIYVAKVITHVSEAFPWENEITVAELLEMWGDSFCAYINSLDNKCRICIPLSCIALRTDKEDGLAPRKAAKMEKRRW